MPRSEGRTFPARIAAGPELQSNAQMKFLVICCCASIAGALTPAELAVVFNTADPNSTELAHYYAAARGVPAENMINVSLIVQPQINIDHYTAFVQELKTRTPAHVQAYALAWREPWRVNYKMSMTSAVALGYDPAWEIGWERATGRQ